MDQHYFLVCPVNSQNEEKLAGQGEARLRLLTNATYPRWTCISPFGVRLSEAYTVVPNMRSTIIVRLHEEAKSQAQQYEQYYYQNRMVERLYSYFFISDKVHIYSGEGRKTAAQHVMMISINQPCSNISWPPCEPVCVFSLLVSLKERRVGSLPSIEIGLLTLLSHMSVICQEEVR